MTTTHHRRKLATFIAICMLTLLACSLFGGTPSAEEPSPTVSAPTKAPPPATEASPPEPTAMESSAGPPPETEAPSSGGALETLTNELTIEGVASTAVETFGRIIQVDVTNPQNEEIEAIIPCGLIFEPPPDSDQQRLMVIQEASATLGPGESASLTPFVMCIDSDQAIPEAGGTYSIGTFSEDVLLEFAQCLCQEEIVIDDFDVVALQFAMWMVSDGQSFDDFLGNLEDAGGALGSVSEGELGEMLTSLADFLQAPVEAWLERCDIQIPEG